MSLLEHAKKEFEVLGWPGECKMQKMVCDDILELLTIFSGQGHSGSSAGYVLNLFNELARFNPISPLTGKDDEWVDVGGGLFQNKRDGEVFKQNGKAYWINGKIFKEADGCTYTNGDSCVDIKFPWTKPKPEIINV